MRGAGVNHGITAVASRCPPSLLGRLCCIRMRRLGGAGRRRLISNGLRLRGWVDSGPSRPSVQLVLLLCAARHRITCYSGRPLPLDTTPSTNDQGAQWVPRAHSTTHLHTRIRSARRPATHPLRPRPTRSSSRPSTTRPGPPLKAWDRVIIHPTARWRIRKPRCS